MSHLLGKALLRRPIKIPTERGSPFVFSEQRVEGRGGWKRPLRDQIKPCAYNTAGF